MNMTNVANIPNGERKQLKFRYDYLGRRALKTEYYWTGSTFSTSTLESNRCVYDGWKVIAEFRLNNAKDAEYTWGQDLSGTMDEAGGIGGLLMIYHWTENDHFPAYDGTGNIVALIKTNQAIAARYEFGPFGEPIRATGPMAKLNPFRWSTKYTDDESGLVYYGYRYYSVPIGKWISKDPVEERSDPNLYLFAKNSPIIYIDSDGRFAIMIGDVKIGVGEVNYAFDKETLGEVGDAFLAVLDGMIPFLDPFKGKAYDETDPMLMNSRALGQFARDLLVIAAIPNFSTWAKNPALYEIGQKTLAAEAYAAVKNLSAIERATRLIKSEGLLKALIPSFKVSDYAGTIGTWLTPGGWMLLGGMADAWDTYFVDDY